MEKALALVTFIILVLVLMILFFKMRKSKLYIIPFIFILSYFIYSFFFVTGSVRLCIFLMGHPYSAYITDFTYGDYGNNHAYLMPKEDIEVTSGSMGYIECKTYGMIKISSYYGC